MNALQIKQRFGIIGNNALLNRAIEIAYQVAPTDISVLVHGESGTGKEVMPQIIHNYSHRKHSEYIAVNCGAIPEGTIDSELFGHEKGAFTGATEMRRGYFEVADGGTIFLDEIGELPLKTQVRLLRILETGEFIRVGSSKIKKTNVRIVAATHKHLKEEIKKGKFREDLFYRLNTVPIHLPPLRERKEDIHLLFRKFSADFAEKYRMPALKLQPDAVQLIEEFYWPGNIRQLKNVAEQISIIEKAREVDIETLKKYIPAESSANLPMIVPHQENTSTTNTMETELLYKMILEMKKDINDVKRLLVEVLNGTQSTNIPTDESYTGTKAILPVQPSSSVPAYQIPDNELMDDHEEVEETLSLESTEKELIKKALKKHRGKRKYAAQELGISERTLYRKIKEYNLQ